MVALESTVIAHGLPRPQNLETARRLEQVVRERGATPATIAILEGKLHVGLSPDQLQHVAEADDIHKISCRDLPLAVAHGWDGATTVAATVWIAHRAGITVLATGGIGGVHRGRLPDVSADLPELARSPLVVVCSGAKIVLDLAATREWLETHGITVIGYGCDCVPAFYSRSAWRSMRAPILKRWRASTGAARLGLRARSCDSACAAEAEAPPSLQSWDECWSEAERQSIGGRD